SFPFDLIPCSTQKLRVPLLFVYNLLTFIYQRLFYCFKSTCDDDLSMSMCHTSQMLSVFKGLAGK
ncbi:hypothetical protein M5D96_005127, partial [Drosophila gunungcola]